MSISQFPNEPEKWGPGVWLTIHTLSKYGSDPLGRQVFIESVRRVILELPCDKCRKHGTAYLEKNPPETAKDLFEWGWKFHNAANAALGKKEISLEEARSVFIGPIGPTADVCTNCSERKEIMAKGAKFVTVGPGRRGGPARFTPSQL